MAEARERQKANIFVKQVVGGKEWVGPPFLAAPKVLLFKDFNVGQTYDLKFTLTNVSYSFNMFRQAPLPEQVRSFFELTHVPPGNPPYPPISPHISPYLLLRADSRAAR